MVLLNDSICTIGSLLYYFYFFGEHFLLICVFVAANLDLLLCICTGERLEGLVIFAIKFVV